MTSAQPSPTTTAQDCDLRAAVQQGPDALTVAYEFRNRSSKTAFLFNVLHKTGPSGGPEPSPDLVYIQVSGGSVVLSKKVFPVPDNIDVEKPKVPYVTRVEPGQVFREKFSVPLPLKPWTPYRSPAVQAPIEASMWFELGFFLAPDPSVARQSGGNLVVYPFRADQQVILRAGPLGRFPIAPSQTVAKPAP